ncbi:MAG: DUF2155 domain-containing protein [Xanthobacteraceae bacterium]
MARIAALLLVIGGTLVVGPAAAQFGNIFGDAPPRPPADVPNGPFPQQPPPVQYPGQPPRPYPGQPAPGYSPPPPPPSAIETQPLPPPPGTSVAPVPPAQGSAQRPPAPNGRAPMTPPASNAAGMPPPPPAAEAPPPDDTVVEAPTPHIENGKAVFAGLDKITGRTISFDVAIGETVQFGALQVTPRACYTRPPTEATNTDAFVEVDEVTLQGEIKRIFTGWMFASSPGLHAVEHPIYDVWLTDCASPQNVKVAEPAVKPPPAPAPAAPKPRQAAPARQRPAAPGVQP